jgi:Uma2 family endonuclease
MTADTERPVASREPPAMRLSYEEFLEWCDEDTLAEWVDGEVRLVSPASERHQALAGFLFTVVQLWAEARELGVVYAAPFQMRLPKPLERGREPDLIFVSQVHRDRMRPTFLDGAADLVVEIVSPESFARDRGEKFVEYEQAGIPEYWLIDPDREQAEFYRLGDESRYQLVLGGRAGLYTSQVLSGLRLRVEWLWQEPLPRIMDVLRELGLVS